MAALPTDLPRWATAGGAKITTPTTTQQDAGWDVVTSTAFPDGKPVLQIANWFYNLVYQWVAWFSQAIFRPLGIWDDLQIVDNDTILPIEFTGPSWPRSTTIPVDWFIGSSIIQGFYKRVGATAATFPNLSDVYVDIGPDGVWDYNAVGNGAGAPALQANHVRFFLFVTNGAAQITDGTYFKDGDAVIPAQAEWLNSSALVRFERQILHETQGLGLDGVDQNVVLHDGPIQARIAGDTRTEGQTDPAAYAANELLLWGNTGATPSQVDEFAWAFGVNARRTGGGWERVNSGGDSYLYILGDEGLRILRHDAADADTWLDTISPTTWQIVFQAGSNASSGNGVDNMQSDSDGDFVVPRDTAIGRDLTVSGTAVVSGAFQASANATVGGDLDVVGLDVSGNAVVDGSLDVASLNFTPTKTLKKMIHAGGGQFDGDSLPGLTVAPFLHGSANGGAVAVDSTTSGAFDYVLPIDLPSGAIVTGVNVYGSVISGGSLNTGMFRFDTQGSGTNVERFNVSDGNGVDNFPQPLALISEMVLTINAAAGVRTIDNDRYAYYLALSGTTGSNIQMVCVEITYTLGEAFAP